MAKSLMQVQKQALKDKAARTDMRFGTAMSMPPRYADGGDVNPVDGYAHAALSQDQENQMAQLQRSSMFMGQAAGANAGPHTIQPEEFQGANQYANGGAVPFHGGELPASYGVLSQNPFRLADGGVIPNLPVTGDAVTPAIAKAGETASNALMAIGRDRLAIPVSRTLKAYIPSAGQFMPAAAGIVGAGQSLMQSPQERADFANSVGATTPLQSAGADAARVLSNVGNAMTGGMATVAGRGIADAAARFGLADGGMISSIQNMRGARDRAIEAAVNPSMAATPATPAAASKPAPVAPAPEPDDAALGIHIPKPAPVPKPVPKKGLFGLGILGLADGGAAYVRGGPVVGPGTGTSDSIPARLSAGEYVLPADTVRAIGKEKLDAVKNATHTPVAAKFGNGLVNGDIVPWDPVNGQRFAPPNPLEPVGPNVNVGAGSPSAEAQAYAGRPRWQQAPAADPAAAAPAADAAADVAPAAAAEAPVGEAPGLLKTAANRVLNARRALAGKAPGAAATAASGSAAAAPGLLSRAAGTFGRGLGAYGAAAGAVQSAMAGEPERDAFEESVTTPWMRKNINPNVISAGANALRTLRNIGDASTFGVASRLGEANAARAAAIDAGKNPVDTVADAAKAFADTSAPRTAPVAPSTSNSVPSASSQVPSAPAPTPDQAVGITPGQRAFFGKAGVDSSYKNVGDFGGDGQTIYRKGNSYVGAGGGTNKATGYVPQGVDFGFKPGEVQAYKDSLAQNAAGFGMGSAPQQYVSPETTAMRSQLADMIAKAPKAGELGFNRAQREIAAKQGQLGAFNTLDQQRTAHDLSVFNANRALWMSQRQLANTAAGYEVQRQGQNLAYQGKMAEVGNEQHKQLVSEAQQRLGNSKDRLTALAKTDGGDPELYQVAASTHEFPGSDGKLHNYQDLDEGSRAKADGYIQLQASKMKARKDAGLPYSLGDAQTNESPGMAGWAYSFLHHPRDTVRFGATSTGSFLTGRPNTYASDEASAADAAQRKARQ